MPHISMRMSASSSMTRISCAIACRFHRSSGHLDVGGGPRLRLAEGEADARAAALAILHDEPAAVVFHDLLDDGKAEAGALGAGCDVGFGQPLPALLRQTAAVILDGEHHLTAVGLAAQNDMPGRGLAVAALD